ncbi:MAG: PilZ domain-containing protein [Myxococcota bacterium]
MTDERRKHDRKKVQIDCEIRVAGQEHPARGRIETMSPGGCFIVTPIRGTFGTKVKLAFSLDRPPRAMMIDCVVRWTSPQGLGVQFLAVGVAAVFALTEYLSDKAPASLPPPEDDKAALLAKWRQARTRDRKFAQASLALQKSAAAKKVEEPRTVASAKPVTREKKDWQVAPHNRELMRLRARVKELEAEHVRLMGERHTLQAALRDRDEQLEHARVVLEQRAEQVETLREALRERPRATEGDDLTRIKGVGPKFADGLRKAGVTRFEHIAAWTESDIEAIATELGTSARRILKAAWVESAAALAAKRTA